MTVLAASPCTRSRHDRVAAREGFVVAAAKVEDALESNFSSKASSASLEGGEHPDGRWSWVIVFASFMAQVCAHEYTHIQ